MICAAGWNSSALIRHEGMRKECSAYVAIESANLDHGGGFRLQSRRSRTAGIPVGSGLFAGERTAMIRPDPSPARREPGANRGVSRAPFAPSFEESCSEVSEARASRSSWFRCSEVKLRNTGTPEPRNNLSAACLVPHLCRSALRVRWGQAGQVGSGKMGSGLFAGERTARIRPDPSSSACC